MILPVTPGTLPNGFCPSSYQQLAEGLAAIYTVSITNTNLSVVASSTKPDVTLQGSVVWQRLDSIGRPVGMYWFAQGAWLSPHPLSPGHTVIFFDVLPDFHIYDGGDSNALSDISGPMWEEATELRARFPVGAGTLPSGKVLTHEDTGGEENHTLTQPEMPYHNHVSDSADESSVFVKARNDFTGASPGLSGSNWGFDRYTGFAGGDPTSGNPPTRNLPHNTMPPFCTVYFLRRTARLFFAVQ